ncbi:MAG TPA: 16S rRNA (guanine(527)-N(7))-methyltransferase RsmG [Nevskiaceae bacterium]|nr:16S rRNA (guanine(527)-N(7))-methyltransferase RsmG [Nevskiaceae bacterium]
MRSLGLSVDPLRTRQLLDYIDELARWNVAYNLTAVRDPRDMVSRHLLDSLAVASAVNGATVVDVGSGAGLPGVPLAVVRPELSFVLLDGSGKRVHFLRAVCRRLGLANVEVALSRAEAWQPALAGPVCVVSRGLARLASFLVVSAGWAGPGTRWLAMKGKLDRKELAEVPSAFVVTEVRRLEVPGLAEARHLVIVERRR